MNLFIAGTDFASVLALFILIIALHSSHKKREKKYSFFMLCLITLMIFEAMDCAAYVMDEIGGNDTVHMLTNFFSYIGADIIFPVFAFYVSEKIRESGPFSEFHAWFILVASIFDMAFLIYGTCTGELFYIENHKIVYGYLQNYVGFIQLILSLYLLGQMFLLRKSLEKKLIYSVAIYFVLPLISLVVEVINSDIALAYMATAFAFLIVYLMVAREDLHASAISEKIMYQASVTDNLTGLLNRRACSDDTALLSNHYPEDFVYLSMDVNGLKVVNDDMGHAAGDEIIKGAAECMQKCFCRYGKVYRVGGDEFTAILYVPDGQVEALIEAFDEEVENWHGQLVDNLSVSVGYVKADEAQGSSIHSISVLADQRMYVAKATFYRKKGVDRRRQFEAHVALCNLYTKTLKINLTRDTYQIINMDEDEQTEDKGFANTISSWLEGFGTSGQVHPDDLENYLKRTNIQYLKDYFNQNKTSISIFYRRKYTDGYKQVEMEMIPAGDYTPDNQNLFLYVKSIDK